MRSRHALSAHATQAQAVQSFPRDDRTKYVHHYQHRKIARKMQTHAVMAIKWHCMRAFDASLPSRSHFFSLMMLFLAKTPPPFPFAQFLKICVLSLTAPCKFDAKLRPPTPLRWQSPFPFLPSHLPTRHAIPKLQSNCAGILPARFSPSSH